MGSKSPAGMPLWEKVTWALIVLYLLVVFLIFWLLGWSRLPFPV